MPLIEKTHFICLDCETTGLDLEKDSIIELALVRFTFAGEIETFDTLVNPGCLIPASSQAIHHISDEMVQEASPIEEFLPYILSFIGSDIIVGHGIGFDVQMIANAATKMGLSSSLRENRLIDTLRLARLYGESPINSLESLRQHFNIEWQESHRALSDVQVNINVFKKLARSFKTTEQLFEALSKPIQMKMMPLGKYKGREFKDLPLNYLEWAVRMDFDDDLIYSLKCELGRRKKRNCFETAGNPFAGL